MQTQGKIFGGKEKKIKEKLVQAQIEADELSHPVRFTPKPVQCELVSLELNELEAPVEQVLGHLSLDLFFSVFI